MRPDIAALLAAALFASPGTVAAEPGYAWSVSRTAWTGDDEARYEEFVAGLGQAVEDRVCRTVHDCLHGRYAHPFRASNPPDLTLRADCADFPYLLRAYFAWKNALPFTYVERVSARPGSGGDLRYSRNGNLVHSRRVIGPGEEVDARTVFRRLAGEVRSGHFRIRHRASDPGLPDFYPVAIRPDAIRPGTVIYDPKGHVAVVYKVTAQGRIYFMDAHPDNSLTRGSYGLKFTQASRPDSAPGFKRWRPFEIEEGRARMRANHLIADHHEEQFFGTVLSARGPRSWRGRVFEIDGEQMGFHDFVRVRLAGAGLRYDPLDEVRVALDDLCVDLEYRRIAVQEAVHAGLDRAPQPARLPPNIYGASGEWETYSTPSRDARFKTSVVELRGRIERFLAMHAERHPRLAYGGGDLRGDLLAVYRERSTACRVTYRSRSGGERVLTLHRVIERLFDLSFDPYHCVERRWGATRAAELAGCADGPVKRAWYAAERGLRNQIERRYDEPMGFTLEALRARGPGTGRWEPPLHSVLALLEPGLERVARREGPAAGPAPSDAARVDPGQHRRAVP